MPKNILQIMDPDEICDDLEVQDDQNTEPKRK